MAKTKKVLPVPPSSFIGLAITYQCGDDIRVARPQVTYEGGCFGWHREGEYCYCPSIEIVAEVACVCGHTHRFDIHY